MFEVSERSTQELKLLPDALWDGPLAKRKGVRGSSSGPDRTTLSGNRLVGREGGAAPIHHREEFVVCGYLASSPSHLSSLIAGQYDREGKLVYSGLVGTGLSNETRLVILRELQATQRKTCPFSPSPDLRDHFGELRTDLPPHWVRPTLVVEVEYRQRLTDGLRHAALKGLRPRRSRC